ncbi:MAG: hypothetical protein GW942_02665 [Candidatus Pacebacteria bacterium]|nr:hypothetical protein [Candidatus Paceibacterota bacterium]
MQDNNLPNNQAPNPSYVDDYQPTSSTSQTSSQPFGAPAAPQMNVNSDDQVSSSGSTNNSDPLAALNDIISASDEARKKREAELGNSSFGDSDQEDAREERLEEPIVVDSLSDDLDIENDDIDGAYPSAPVSDNNSQGDDPSILADQSLETQNIFDLLGVSDGNDDEKEAFLDELQEVIWEDFIENDVELLLNEEQLKELREIEEKGQTREVQEEMLVYLEELLPDLEDIMMDKALELKEDMVLERISGMKEFYSGNQNALDQITRAEELISENKWSDAGNLLNSIK